MVRARAGSDDGGGLLRLLHASGGLLSPRMLYKAMRGLLWSLWGLIQYVNGQPLRRLPPLPTRGLERCSARVGSEDFGCHLATVARAQGPSAPARPYAPRKSIYSSAMRATI